MAGVASAVVVRVAHDCSKSVIGGSWNGSRTPATPHVSQKGRSRGHSCGGGRKSRVVDVAQFVVVVIESVPVSVSAVMKFWLKCKS
jgi:hypothetical protein